MMTCPFGGVRRARPALEDVVPFRLDLTQMVMLKDNHVWSAGSITSAVSCAKRAAGFSSKIEVECRDLEEAYEAGKAGADIVMLDNYKPEGLLEDARTFKTKYPGVLIEVIIPPLCRLSPQRRKPGFVAERMTVRHPAASPRRRCRATCPRTWTSSPSAP